MTAATITEQLSQPFVGNIIDLFHIDLTPIGSTEEFFLTPSSSSPITFNSQVYTPFPITIEGLDRSLENAPGRVTLSISNMTQMLGAMILSYGDMVGGHVTYIRTFDNFLDGSANGGTNQSFPVLRYIIYQKAHYSQSGMRFVLTTELDRPGSMLPRRQILKSDVGTGNLYAPGMARFRV